jgi:hypothetical protein
MRMSASATRWWTFLHLREHQHFVQDRKYVLSMALNVITVSTALALGLAAGLLAVDLLAWRIVAAMFARELLVTGTGG